MINEAVSPTYLRHFVAKKDVVLMSFARRSGVSKANAGGN